MSSFSDSIIIGDCLLMGNYYERLFMIDLLAFRVDKIDTMSHYFCL